MNLLILVGTVLVSYFTASLASYFTEKEQDIEQERIEKKLDNLIEEVKNIQKIKNPKKITQQLFFVLFAQVFHKFDIIF